MKKFVKDENGNQVEVDVTYKNITFEDILAYCQENNEVEWLKKYAATPIAVLDEEKNPVLDEDGNPKTRPITFIDLKLAFVDKYMKEIAPKREPKKPSMFDRIKSL